MKVEKPERVPSIEVGSRIWSISRLIMWSLSPLYLGFIRRSSRQSRRHSKQQRPVAAMIERMEPKAMLFATTGNAWPNSHVVTISFEPDGTNLGGVTSNLNAAFNGNAALVGKWQAQILKAAQSWAAATNLNFVVLGDSGVASGAGSYQQGDPTIGDIRIGGYNFGNSTLARAYAPPPVNNYSIAGDIAFNTAIPFGIGTNYDLFTVAAHEVGHALGLDHTSASNRAEMWPSYNGAKPTLAPDDMAGIRNIYSSNLPRSEDDYDKAAVPNTSFAAAANVSGLLNATTHAAVISGLDLTTSTETDYFKITAPAGSSSTATIGVQSLGLSLLSPQLTVYAADQTTILGTASGLNQYGATLNVRLTGVIAGQTCYVKVKGADTSVFSMGQYALTLNLGTGATPAVPNPNTAKLKGTVLSGGGGIADSTSVSDDLLPGVPCIRAVSPDTGASSVDRLTDSKVITLNGAAPNGYTVKIYQSLMNQLGAMQTVLLGSLIVAKHNEWSFVVPGNLADGIYTYLASGFDLGGAATGTSASFTVTVDTHAPAAPAVFGFSPDSGSIGDGITNSTTPTIFGTAAPNSLVQFWIDGQCVTGGYSTGNNIGNGNGNGNGGGSGNGNGNGNSPTLLIADSQGKWTYTVSNHLNDGLHVFKATATDIAGNTSVFSAALNVTIVTRTPSTPQVATIASTINHETGFAELTITGISDLGNTITIWLDGVFLANIIADTSGAWTLKYSSITLTNNTHSVTTQATDKAGNRSNASSARTVTISGLR